MRPSFTIIVLLFSLFINAGEAADYLREFSRTGMADYKKEQEIVAGYTSENLTNEISPFYNDSVALVRQKAYYLTYKNAIVRNEGRGNAVNILLKGCFDNDNGVVYQNVSFLKEFNRADFDTQALDLLQAKLTSQRIAHYKEFVLLAGFLGTGKNILYQKFIDPGTNEKQKWYLSLALARMGNPENISYCMNKVRNLPINDNVVDYVVPDLVYIRQKESIDFCISILNGEEKLCHSLNPDVSESIHCGFRIMDILSPIIEGMPVLDESLNLSNADYEKHLAKVRQWFASNPNYIIKYSTF
ncbi:MAG TPA: hypothetical protein PK839_10355 [Tenuifilaceae bacterium]|jgi:hypothetical protein|nr:hypothetical protein [Tenuifilaceae bacterium]HRC95037.1 hypothetical protein [Tenuifilaceae bacterium]